jgi:hypothetical protein
VLASNLIGQASIIDGDTLEFTASESGFGELRRLKVLSSVGR